MTDTPNPDAQGIDERLTEYRELLEQFEAVRDRLRRAEEERQTVPRRVYDKVRAEYDRQLDALRARMTPLRDALDQVRDQYESRLKDENGALEAVEEELAELAFRHRIGEFPDEAAATQRAEIEARLEEVTARIGSVRESLSALEDATPETPAAEAPAPPQSELANEPAETAPAPQAPRAEVPPLADAGLGADAPIEAEPEQTPAAETATTAVVDPPASARRPVLRASTPENAAPVGFENPHDWVEEVGSDSRRRESDAPSKPAVTPSTQAPAPAAAPPSLVFVSGPHAGQSIPLLTTTLTIGREHDNNIEIKDADVARYHARILNDRGEYVIEDMASTTGTWVNGTRAQRAPLGHGDVIRIGQTEIAVDFEWASNSLERAGIDPTT
jgi:hypothetical protein